LLLTAVVALTPWVSFSYHAPTARVILETTVTLVGSLAALLCFGRWRRSGNPIDLATAVAMILLAVSYPLLAALPGALADDPGERIGTWGLVCARVASAALLVIAGWLGSRMRAVANPRTAVAIVSVPLVAAGAALVFLASRDPHSLQVTGVSSNSPHPLADPLVAAIELGAALLFAVAAVQFSQRSRAGGDRFVVWLGVGCALLGVASLNYGLSPSLELAWLHSGDLFRAIAVVAVAIGAVEEIRSYWEGMAQLARSEERRSLARDLHDGLAQELAYLVSQTQAPEAGEAPLVWRQQLRSSAERALAESRRSIRALTSESREPFQSNVRGVAAEAVERAVPHIDLVTEGDFAGTFLAPHEQESVLRIVREAVTNAVRHSRATRIVITADGHGPRTIQISDNGTGFDPSVAALARSGFGLVSMRERADSVGASFAIDSAPGSGTTLRITWQ
jgi:signal transduction histidine kinase